MHNKKTGTFARLGQVESKIIELFFCDNFFLGCHQFLHCRFFNFRLGRRLDGRHQHCLVLFKKFFYVRLATDGVGNAHRTVLAEFGTHIPDDVEVRVSDSTAIVRYLVLPKRPNGTEHCSEEQLAALVTRDAMIGVIPVTIGSGQ